MSCIPIALSAAGVTLLVVRLVDVRRRLRLMRDVDWYVWRDGQAVPLHELGHDAHLNVVDDDGTIRPTKRGNES